MTTYIVSGHMRHGTSAMMGALIAGGMDAHFDPKRMDELAPQTKYGDATPYNFNAEVYEPNRCELSKLGFPRGYEGRLLKVLWGGLPKLAPMKDGYRFVVMQRDPEEARQSHEGGFAPVRGTARAGFLKSADAYREHFEIVGELLAIRTDTRSVDWVNFRDELVADPASVFTRLQDSGWPIKDVDAAVAFIDEKLVHFKIEELEVGI